MSSVHEVLVVCTDRGQHERLPIAQFDCRDDGESRNVSLRPAVDVERDEWAEERIRYDGDRRPMIELRCPRCHRSPRHTLRQWSRVASAWAERQIAELDMSQLGPILPVSD